MDVRTEFVEAALNGVVRGGLVAGVVWLCMHARLRISVSARVFVWSICLLAMVVLMFPLHRVLPIERAPFRTTAVQFSDGAVEDDGRAVGPVAGPIAATAGARSAGRAVTTAIHAVKALPRLPVPRIATLQTGPWASVLAFGWLVVTGALLARVVFGAFVLLRLKRAARVLGHEWQSRLHALCMSHDVRRRVVLAATDDARGPMLVGIGTPFVLVPDVLLRTLDAEQLELVLLHEIEHLRLRHDWTALFDAVLRAVLFFHLPLLWVLRRLELEREIQCDDAVLRRTGRAATYAAALLRVAQMSVARSSALAPSAMLHRRDLVLRFKHILSTRPARSFTRLSALLILTVFAATTALLAGAPRWIEIRRAAEATSQTTQAERAVRADASVALNNALLSLESEGFAGGVVVVRSGSVVLRSGYGMADRERGIRHDASTLYDVAGVTKAFTAAAILQLESEGKLRTSDRASRYIGTLPGVKANATIEQLLNHTSGLTARSSDVQRGSRAAFLQAVRDAPADFAAGTSYRYTDIGYSVLAAVIERASGTSYESYVRDRLIRPAQMKNTSFENDVAPGERRLAKEYAVDASGFVPVPLRPLRLYVWGRRGALGLVTTLDDLYRWQKAVDSGVVLPRAEVEKMYANLGYESQTSPSRHRIVRRLGGTPTLQAELIAYPDDDVVVIFAINNRVGWHPRVWRAIEGALFGDSEGVVQ